LTAIITLQDIIPKKKQKHHMLILIIIKYSWLIDSSYASLCSCHKCSTRSNWSWDWVSLSLIEWWRRRNSLNKVVKVVILKINKKIIYVLEFWPYSVFGQNHLCVMMRQTGIPLFRVKSEEFQSSLSAVRMMCHPVRTPICLLFHPSGH